MKKKILSILLALFFSTEGGAFSSKPSEKGALEPLTLCLGWFLNPNYTPLLIGMQKGYFQEAGIDLRLVASASPEEGCKLVSAQSADMAIASQPRLYFMVSKGLSLVRIATLIDHPLSVVVSDAPLKTPLDWKGQKAGTTGSVGSLGSFILKHIQSHPSLKPGDVTEIVVHRASAAAFLSGKVNILLNAYKTYELADIKNHQNQVYVYPYKDFDIPSYEEIILVIHPRSINQRKIRRFIKALEKSIDYIKRTKPEVLWESLIEAAPELATSLNRQVFEEALPHFTGNPRQLQEKAYREFKIFAESQKFVSRPLPPLSYFATEIKEG